MHKFDTVSRIGDSLIFHMRDDENAPCTGMDAAQVRGLALALLEGVTDIEERPMDESQWPGIIFNTAGN